MYDYKNSDEEKIVCPEYEREASYSVADDNSTNIDSKVDEVVKLILDIDITVMNNGEEYIDSLDAYLDEFDLKRLKDKIKLILEK